MSDVLSEIDNLIQKDPDSPVSKVLQQAVEKARANVADDERAQAYDLYMGALSRLNPRASGSSDPRVVELRKRYGIGGAS